MVGHCLPQHGCLCTSAPDYPPFWSPFPPHDPARWANLGYISESPGMHLNSQYQGCTRSMTFHPLGAGPNQLPRRRTTHLPQACAVLGSVAVVSDSATPWLQPARLLCPWDCPGKNTGVGCHFLLQGILPNQGLIPGILHCKRILYQLTYQGSPRSSLITYKGLAQAPLLHDTSLPPLLCPWIWRNGVHCYVPCLLNLTVKALPQHHSLHHSALHTAERRGSPGNSPTGLRGTAFSPLSHFQC